MSKTNSASDKQYEHSFYTLLCKYFVGLVPIDAVLEHAEFQRRLKQYSSIHAGTAEDAADLYQEAILRVFLYQHTLGPQNTPNERAFFGWLFILTRNTFLSSLRSRGVQIDDQPLEEVEVADSGLSPEDKCYQREMEEFSKSLPDNHQLAVEYYLQGYSFREIVRLLNGSGIRCSHTTVRTWVRDALYAFSQGRSTYNTKPQLKKALK